MAEQSNVATPDAGMGTANAVADATARSACRAAAVGTAPPEERAGSAAASASPASAGGECLNTLLIITGPYFP